MAAVDRASAKLLQQLRFVISGNYRSNSEQCPQVTTLAKTGRNVGSSGRDSQLPFHTPTCINYLNILRI